MQSIVWLIPGNYDEKTGVRISFSYLDKKSSTSLINFNVPVSICLVNESKLLKSGCSTNMDSMMESNALWCGGNEVLVPIAFFEQFPVFCLDLFVGAG